MAELTITHTPATGTLLDGTTRGDGVNVVLRAAPMQWKWSPTLQQFYVQRSRDRVVPDRYGIERTADALRAEGHTVTVETGGETRTAQEREQDRAERTERRVDMLTERAERRAGEATAAWNAEHAILDHIPAGQPILVGHHSERRHRRALDRADGHMRRGIDAHNASKAATSGAESAEASQRLRKSGPQTMRRIETLEAEERKLQRSLDGYERRANIHGQSVVMESHGPATGEHRDRVEALLADAQEQLRYWRGHLAELQESGEFRVWTRADFTKGDLVQTRRDGWAEVLRVNAKSLTVPHILPELAAHGHTWKLPFDEVKGRKSAVAGQPEQTEATS